MKTLERFVAAVGFSAASLFVGSAATAVTLDTSSTEYLGYYTPGEPANEATEASNINVLLDLLIGTSSSSNGFSYVRSSNECVDCPDATADGASKDESQSNEIDLGDGWLYLIGKYDGPKGGSLVWYVGDLEGTIDIIANWGPADKEYGLSHWTLFNPVDGNGNGNGGGPENGNGNGNNVPEPGSLVLLGLGLAGIGLMRRRRTV